MYSLYILYFNRVSVLIIEDANEHIKLKPGLVTLHEAFTGETDQAYSYSAGDLHRAEQ